MKRICLFAIFMSILLTGCSEKVYDPVFEEGEFYIHVESWAKSSEIEQGTSLKRTVRVSPADGSVSCCWTLDDKVVSNNTEMSWAFNQIGTYTLVFTAEKDGVVKTRTATITVTAPKSEAEN